MLRTWTAHAAQKCQPCDGANTRHVSSVPLTRKLTQLVEDLAVVDDPQERLSLVVERARNLAPLTPGERVDANRVPGCVSVVWLVGDLRDGRCRFRCHAESPVVHGLVALLCEFFSGFAPELIAGSDADPLEALGLVKNLSPTRRNGLAAARATIKGFARRQISQE